MSEERQVTVRDEATRPAEVVDVDQLHAFLSQVMPFTDPDLETLCMFARFETKLAQDPNKETLQLEADVALRYGRLDKLSDASIVLRVAETGMVYGATEVGTKKAKDDPAQLSETIEVPNERVGTAFNQTEEILFDQFVAAAKLGDEVVQRAKANPLDKFALAYRNHPHFQDRAFRPLVQGIYDELRAGRGEAMG
jgi:type I restriction enzyme R subunit